MNARFYAPDAHAPGALATLPDEEAVHLARVLRLQAGDAVAVFNGRGGEFHALVESIARDRVEVRIGAAKPAAAEARVALTLVHAVLKGDKMDGVVRDAVMMGVAAVQPLLTVRTEISRATLERGRRRERWERIAVSSAKQCGRAVVPSVLAPVEFDALPEAMARRHTRPLMLVEPAAAAATVAFGEIETEAPAEAALVVGPEGGWTPEEIGAAAGVCRLVTLGGRTLRADAMAIVAIAALFAKWNEF